MGSYDWMELQTLTAEIAASRARLVAARKTRDMGRARALEEEITAAEARRERLLAHITTNLVSAPEGAAPSKDKEAAAAEPPPAPQVEPEPPTAAADVAAVEPPPPEPEPPAEEAAEAAAAAEPPAPAETAAEAAAAQPPPAEEAAEPAAAAPAAVASPAPARRAGRAEGEVNVWDQLTPSDLERAKRDLTVRRAEMLARHAAELKALEADRAQLDGLEQAISVFLQKFSGGAPAATAGVVKLDEERELRQQGAG